MKKLLIAFAVLLFIALVIVTARGRISFGGKTEEADGEYFRLGTIVRLRLFGKDKKFLEGELERADAEIARLEALLSANAADSEVRRAGGEWVRVSPETYELLRRALEIAEETNGAFDPAIGRITGLWKIGTEEARVPGAEEIRAALPRCGYRNISLKEEDGARFIKLSKGARIDLGAIAKGRAADILAKKLCEDGVKSALIDLGGNLALVGAKPDGKAWRLGIQDPGKARGEYFGVVETSDGSVVTSGPYERFFEKEGVRYHHIFDPETGYPAKSEFSSVTVADRDSTKADALCTAFFVMGRARAEKYLEKHKEIAAIFLLDGENRILITDAARGLFTPSDKSFSLESIGKGKK